jgi:hypothetical protein
MKNLLQIYMDIDYVDVNYFIEINFFILYQNIYKYLLKY